MRLAFCGELGRIRHLPHEIKTAKYPHTTPQKIKATCFVLSNCFFLNILIHLIILYYNLPNHPRGTIEVLKPQTRRENASHPKLHFTSQATNWFKMVYTIVVHLYAKPEAEAIAKLKAKLVEASQVYSKDKETLSWFVMQDTVDPRAFTIVERYLKESVR